MYRIEVEEIQVKMFHVKHRRKYLEK